MKNVLSIAGIDPSGGAGLLADIKVFIAHKCYAMGVATATTSQNTSGIFGMELISPNIIKDGIEKIFEDIRVDAIKIGVVPSVDIIKSVAETLKGLNLDIPIVLDPVMACKNGNIWLEENSKEAMVKHLFPLATIITPNRFEACEALKIKSIDSIESGKEAAKELLKFGSKAVFLKLGEIDGNSVDIFYDGSEFIKIVNDRLETNSTHGSGCSLSSAIAANLANAKSLENAVQSSVKYVFNAIKNAPIIGKGCNPIAHFHGIYE